MLVVRAVALMVFLSLSGVVAAQPDDCTRGWSPGWTRSGADGAIDAMATFDPDGSGPAGPVLALAGEFYSIDGVVGQRAAIWNGERFEAMDAGLAYADISGLETLDPDGPGPSGAELYALGRIWLPGVQRPVGVVRWTTDGGGGPGHWARLGVAPAATTEQAQVVGLVIHDFDGAGPDAPRLVAISTDSPTLGSVQQWDGAAWIAVGSNNNLSALNGIASVDHDGGGPNPPVLYVSAGSSGVLRLAGTNWEAVSGLNGSVGDIASFDLDGPGPQVARLVAMAHSNSFVVAGSIATVAAYDGAAWQGLGSVGLGSIQRMLRSVPGPFPGSPPTLTLSLMGAPQVSIYRWSESGSPPGTPPSDANWARIALSPVGLLAAAAVRAITFFDSDGSGADPATLVVGGEFKFTSDGLSIARLASIRAGHWRPLTRFSAVPDGPVLALKAFDADGGGPQPGVLFAGGLFPSVAQRPAAALAGWDGGQWRAVGAFPPQSVVQAMEVYDDDGDGPHPPGLYVGGYFESVDGAAVGSIARLDADGWTGLGAGFEFTGLSPDGVTAMTVADLDGPGPQHASLLVASDAETVDGLGSATIAAWNGAQWTPMGAGAPSQVVGFGVFPRQGEPPQLIAVSAYGILSIWNGSSWRTWASTTGSIRFSTLMEHDADGLAEPELIIGGNFGTVAGVWAFPGLARYDGHSWSALTVAGQDNFAYAGATIDFDGAGPEPARLVLAGEFADAGGTSQALAVRRVAPDGGVTFELMGGYAGANGYMVMSPFADNPGQPPAIYIAGSFTGVDRFANPGAMAAAGMARYGCPACIAFAAQPGGRLIRAGKPLTLSAAVANQPPGLTYRWRRDGVDLTDGGTVQGASTPSLTITGLRMSDAGRYDLRVTAPCGTAVSAGAVVSVSCEGDFNADGHIGIDDVIGYIQAYLTDDPSADFSGNYHLTLQDLFDFLGAYFGGC